MFCRNCGKELTGIPEICMGCGARPLAGNSFCGACGAETNPLAEICIKCGVRLSEAVAPAVPVPAVAGDVSPKSRLATTLLAWFLGIYGAHQFYTVNIGAGIAMLILGILGSAFFIGEFAMAIMKFFAGILGPIHLPFPFRFIFIIFLIPVAIWAFVDFIYAVFGRFRDADGKLIQNWGV